MYVAIYIYVFLYVIYIIGYSTTEIMLYGVIASYITAACTQEPIAT